MTAYCMACKKTVEIEHPERVMMKNGKFLTKGLCPKCQGKVCRFG